jgi:ribosome-binding factor A
MSRRSEQVAAEIHRGVQAAIDRGLQDPRVSGMVTVTAVEVTEDLKTAHLRVSVLPADRQELTLHGLRAAAPHLRHLMGDQIRIRQMPELVFRLDSSLKKQAAVMDAIARATAERQKKEAAAGPSQAGSVDPAAYAQSPDPEERPE